MTVSLDTLSSPTLHDPASLLDYFTELADPRREQGRFHRLDEIIFISICAVTCGADSWEEIASYAHSKIDWLQTVLTLPGGVPSHDTFRRVFCLLDPLAFQECFYAWMTAVMNRRGLTPVPLDPPELKPVAIDGKCQRGSARRTVGQSALHVVSAWSVENHLTLGQVATDAKSNEITAIPELLELLDLEGAVVTIDAMGCQKDIAAKIVGGGGQDVLAVKENQPHLYEDIERAFDEALDQGEPGVDFTECQTEGPRKGRQETRTCCVITNPKGSGTRACGRGPRSRPQEADLIEMILRRRGLEVLRDEQEFRPGSPLEGEIREYINKCDYFIAIWCAEYACSPWCFDELGLAIDRLAAEKLHLWIMRVDKTEIVPPAARKLLYYKVDGRSELEKRIIELLARLE